MASASESALPAYGPIRTWFNGCVCGVLGYVLLAACVLCALTLVSWTATDPAILHSSPNPVQNMLGPIGAIVADIIIHLFGLTGVVLVLPPLFWGLQLITVHRLDSPRVRIVLMPIAIALLACASSSLPTVTGWPLGNYGMGGIAGDQMLKLTSGVLAMLRPERAAAAAGLFCFAGGLMLLAKSIGLSRADVKLIFRWPTGFKLSPILDRLGSLAERRSIPRIIRREPSLKMPGRSMFQPAFVPAPFALPSAPSMGDSLAREARMHEPRLELPSEETSEIARRFAPARREANSEPVEMEFADEQWTSGETYAQPEPVAPKQKFAPPARQEWRAPERNAWPPMAQPPRHDPAFDDLYGRAVAIVLRDRKASKEYLQQRLAIGYMRASDIVERMEYDGILGAPIYNGMRPILMDAHGSGEV
jgi:hypothetical protein